MRALAFLVTILASQFVLAAEPDKKELPKPLPESITKAWTDAGATAGWMKYDADLGLVFVEKPEAGAIPAFKFAKWKEGVVAKLPAPQASFGLYLAKTEIQDAGLKELANFKTLGSICLCETEVTFDAVDAFQKLFPKCFIFHC
jgi:hypothetical protein